MGIITEAEIRNLIRQPQRGASLVVAAGTRFSPSAEDFIKHWQIEVVYGEAAPQGAAQANGGPPASPAAWDKPGAFPVHLEGDLPTCVHCGMPVTDKPEHLTQLDAGHFAAKNTPRIRLRGKLDTLNALCLLAGARARSLNLSQLEAHLNTLAAYCREIMSAEYNDREAAPLDFAGLDDAALRRATHKPLEHVGIDHIVPGPEDHEILHWLNYLRCQVREAEIAALDAIAPVPAAAVSNTSLVRAVNRLSSAVYYLELLFRAGKLGWSMHLSAA